MTYCRPGSPVCGGGLTLWPCASALGPNSVMAPAARPVAAVPFRKLRRDVEWNCGLPGSHSMHMIFTPPTALCHPGSVIPLSLARECPSRGHCCSRCATCLAQVESRALDLRIHRPLQFHLHY